VRRLGEAQQVTFDPDRWRHRPGIYFAGYDTVGYVMDGAEAIQEADDRVVLGQRLEHDASDPHRLPDLGQHGHQEIADSSPLPPVDHGKAQLGALRFIGQPDDPADCHGDSPGEHSPGQMRLVIDFGQIGELGLRELVGCGHEAKPARGG
jgi:hypothetical protein